MKFQKSFCVVDSSLRLLWIGGDWDEFARANGGDGAVANEVLSTPLPMHITDRRTAEKVAQMVHVVLDLQKPLRFEYRCDSPNEIRRFRLTIQPMKDQRAIMVHDLQDAVQIEPPMVAWAFDPTATNQKCSMCGSLHRDGRWIDPIEPGVEHPSAVRYVLCSPCDARADAAIDATRTGRSPADMVEISLKSGLKPD